MLQHFEDIGHSPDDQDVTFENAQARTRTLVLMDWANQTGGLVIGTGDLSELALGWATYNGDHMSMYGVNASIPKTLIRHLVSYEAEKLNDPRLKEVLMDILDTPVSPSFCPLRMGRSLRKPRIWSGLMSCMTFIYITPFAGAFLPLRFTIWQGWPLTAPMTRKLFLNG